MTRNLAILAILLLSILASGATLLVAPKKTFDAKPPAFETFIAKEAPPPSESPIGTQGIVTSVTDLATPKDVEIGVPIVIVAGSARYEGNVPLGSTAFDAMSIIAGKGSFKFKAKQFSGLGYFIEEMEGVKNSGGKYWTLYINGEYSTAGASGYEIKTGDIIEWKFEKK